MAWRRLVYNFLGCFIIVISSVTASANQLPSVVEADSLFRVGQQLCDVENDFSAAKLPLEAALQLTDSTAAPEEFLNILDKLIKCYYRLHESEVTTRLALRGYQMAEKLKLDRQRMKFIQWLGRAVEIEGKWEEAIRYYGRVLDLAKKGDDLNALYNAQLNVAVTKFKSGDPASGLLYMNDCVRTVREMGNPADLVADNDLWLGIMLRNLKRLEEAVSNFQKALPVFDSTGLLYRQTHVRLELAQSYLDMGRPGKAIPYVEEVFAVAGDRLTDYERLYGNNIRYTAYREMGEYSKAFAALEEKHKVELQLSKDNDLRTLEQLTDQYEIKEQRLIIADQKREIEDARAVRLLGTAIVLLVAALCGLMLFFLIRVRRLNGSLNVALDHQQALRGELHHRVKNNLQVIISLLNLQEMRTTDETTKDSLRTMSERVYSISAVHELLYPKHGGSYLDFQEYTHSLCNHAAQLWDNNMRPRFDYHLGDYSFNLDTLVPLGIVISELLTNTRKNFSNPGVLPQIGIMLEEEGPFFKLTYRDNGPGFPAGEMEERPGGMGKYLLRSMSRQLAGSYETFNDGGAVVIVRFQLKNDDSPSDLPGIQV